MRLTAFVALVVLLSLKEVSSSVSAFSMIGYAAALVICGGISLCACGLELLAFVLIATYVVVFMVLFVVILGWRGSSIVTSGLRQYHIVVFAAIFLTQSWLINPVNDLAWADTVTAYQYSSHITTSSVSQLNFAQVMQSLFARVFLIELILINLAILFGFQLSASLLTSLSRGSRQAATSARVRRSWRRTSSARHIS